MFSEIAGKAPMPNLKAEPSNETAETHEPAPAARTGRSPMAMLKWIQLPVMLLTVVALAWLLARDFRGDEFQQVLSQASVPLLLAAMLPSLIALLIKGARLCYLGKSLGFELDLWQGIKYQTIAISLASLTPGRAGEFSKVLLLARQERNKLGLATMAVVFERLFDMMALGLFALGFCLICLHNGALSLALMGMLALLMGMAALLIRLGSRDIARLQKFVPARLHFLLGQMPSVAWQRLVVQALLTIVIWGFEGLGQWAILYAAGINTPLLLVLGINALVAISAILSILPVGLGTVELSALVLYGSALHVPQAGVLFLVAASRVLSLTPLFILFSGIVLTDRGLMKELKDARKPQA